MSKSKDEVVGQIYSTMDYDKFNFERTNRDIGSLKKLREVANTVGFLTPILVNQQFVIIDGQHRFSVSRDLKIPIKYIIVENAGTDEIISLNTTNVQWALLDFIQLYAKEGNEDYQNLLDLYKHRIMPISTMVTTAMNIKASSGTTTRRAKEGKFKFHNYLEYLNFIDFYVDLVDNLKLETHESIGTSIYELFKLQKFDRDRFIIKARATQLSQEIEGLRSRPIVLEKMLVAYNNGLKKSNELYVDYILDKKRDIIILNDIKDTLK